MGITYQEENLKNFILDFAALLKPHMAEINITQKLGFEFSPDYDRYVRLQDAGIFTFITCRDGDKLIGYSSFSIMPHIRYTACKMATEDLYYITPEYRSKGFGKQLFIESEKILKEKGVNQIVFSTKTYSDNSHIFEQLGYELFEKHFTKRIL